MFCWRFKFTRFLSKLINLKIDLLTKQMQTQRNELSTCGPYKVLRTLGEGGNAVIKLAEMNGEQFALKILLLGDSNSETVIRKAKEEFEIVKALNLPGVMRYHKFEEDAVWTNGKGKQRKVAYLVMEVI